ncbi:MAG TPA: FmdE family protein [Acidobacteriaceae bacterium]|jgi:formylmethanofuran dehydrogenase subunit E|nr:FmdE family protein [Acidobacteriaceae bacterium]
MSLTPAPVAVSSDLAELDLLLHEAELAHGHLCAGQILGVRMAILAMRRLGIRSPRLRTLPDGTPNPDRKRPVVFVEIDRCATDAIAVVTGARVGKRALKLRDWGKMAATFIDLAAPLPHAPDTFRGIRLVALESSKDRARDLFPTLPKNEAQMRSYRELPDAELFSEQWVAVPLPPSEFPGYKGQRLTCDRCGEGINFDRFELRDHQRLCQPCAHPDLLYFHPL